MAWTKTLISYGGITQGQVIPYYPAMFYPYSVGPNDYYIIQSENGSDGVNNDINSFYIDLPYTAGETLNDYVAVAKFPVKNSDGEIVRYIGVRYKYASEFSFGTSRITAYVEFGYFDLQNNFTSMAGRSGSTYSAEGDLLYAFKLRLHICCGTTTGETPYDFFGAIITMQSTLRDKFVYVGVLDARQYVQGDLEYGPEVSEEFGPGSEPEGYTGGGFDDHSDQITLPPKPQSILSLGFLNVYKCDASSLVNLGAELFPEITFPTSLSDVGEVLAAVSDSIWNSKLIDYVVSVHCVPGNVTAGALEDIKIGARTMTGILARKISDEYVDVDFGSISVDPYYNNYADYMCEIQLYLPMYGYISLKPEEIIGGEIKLVYRINVIDGSFQAFVFSTSNRSKMEESLIGQYGGSCVVHLPVSNLSYSTMFSGLVGGAGTAAMGIASGGTMAMAAGALTATNMVTQAVQGGDTKKSNSYSASSSFMTRLKPYVIVTRPLSSFSTRYNVENGLPSNVAKRIGDCTGLTICDTPILNFGTTEEIGREIVAALKEGIIL